MSKIGLIVLLSFLSGRALSQNYFVFIGSDDRQVFYVRIDSQLYASSTEGHLLLAPLKDSDYTMTIGFPGGIFPEKRYVVSIHGKDREFGLKRQDDGSWRLYDVLAKNWVTAVEKETRGEAASTGIKKDNAFSRMMAGVVHDTAVLYNTYAMEEVLIDSPVVQRAPAPDSAVTRRADSAVKRRADSAVVRRADSAVVRRADSAVVRRGDSVAPKRVDSAAARNTHIAVARRVDSPVVMRADSSKVGSGAVPIATPGSGVVKLNEKKSSRAVRQVYMDNQDTIVVIIPRDTGAVVVSGHIQTADTARTKAFDAPKTPSANSPGTRTADNRMAGSVDTARVRAAGTQTAGTADTPGARLADTASRQTKTMPFINSDCHNYATDLDVDRLRVKMMDAAKDEDKVAAARKVFKTKCFYTPQVRALSEVFTSDAGKFRFFEAAWPFAADEHFQELSALLSDPEYVSKFRTMTGARP